jgi:hypothetical protein
LLKVSYAVVEAEVDVSIAVVKSHLVEVSVVSVVVVEAELVFYHCCC